MRISVIGADQCGQLLSTGLALMGHDVHLRVLPDSPALQDAVDDPSLFDSMQEMCQLGRLSIAHPSRDSHITADLTFLTPSSSDDIITIPPFDHDSYPKALCQIVNDTDTLTRMSNVIETERAALQLLPKIESLEALFDLKEISIACKCTRIRTLLRGLYRPMLDNGARFVELHSAVDNPDTAAFTANRFATTAAASSGRNQERELRSTDPPHGDANGGLEYSRCQSSIQKIGSHFCSELSDKKFCIWGCDLEDDPSIRESESVKLIRWLVDQHARVSLYVADNLPQVQELMPNGVEIVTDRWAAIGQADALVLAGRSRRHSCVNGGMLHWYMKGLPVIFDEFNCLNLDDLKLNRGVYYGVGVVRKLGSGQTDRKRLGHHRRSFQFEI